MHRIAVALFLLTSPAVAQSTAPAPSAPGCTPIGKTVRGELVYALSCTSVQAEDVPPNYKPPMAPTEMKETVIPKAGGTQASDSAPTTGTPK